MLASVIERGGLVVVRGRRLLSVDLTVKSNLQIREGFLKSELSDMASAAYVLADCELLSSG